MHMYEYYITYGIKYFCTSMNVLFSMQWNVNNLCIPIVY